MDSDSLSTAVLPTSPTSKFLSRIAPLQPFPMLAPPTPEISPTVTHSAYQPFVFDPPEPELQEDTPTKPRTIVLCFDGTGNKFGQENSNVVRFFRALVKNRRHEQIVYYQPGIGTYNKRAFITHTVSTLASAIDSAIALHLDDHVKEGYKFIIQSYRPGDKICLFGFSRGAHTARVVAGMLYKIGIIPKENIQQVDFAFNIYGTTGYAGYKLSREFKQTFASPVSVDFVGVWDTVSSVGLIPQMHPYTSINYAVKTFRHALALDERRARFRPNVWNEMTPDREQELDIDLPEPSSFSGSDSNRDAFTYVPPDRDYADTNEVWFSGCHADIGGGSHSTRRPSSLSSIPLRWMIKEVILARTAILFDFEYLAETLELDFEALWEEMGEKGVGREDVGGEGYALIEKYAREAREARETREAREAIEAREARGAREAREAREATDAIERMEHHHHHLRRYIRDIRDAIFDQLLLVWMWWILEIIPTLCTFQDANGDWFRKRTRNLGRGRYIPFHQNEVHVHESVQLRIQETKHSDKPYVPNAHNWNQVTASSMLKYVK
ncbi:hypothetical protein APHAL10511_000532 [Amanita phalloides]|nr:hypothetical protein APHAL10511_000532 [Amanita phalloides]